MIARLGKKQYTGMSAPGSGTSGSNFSDTIKSLNFDGVDEYTYDAYDASVDSSTTNASMAIWFKAATPPDFRVLCGYYGTVAGTRRRLAIMALNDGSLQIYAYGTGGSTYKAYKTTSTSLLNSAWHHAVATWSSGTLKIYIDGVEDTTVTKVVDNSFTSLNTPTAGWYAVAAGFAAADAAAYFFNGKLLLPATWSSTLSAAEISTIYNSGVPIALDVDSGSYASSANLMRYYLFYDNVTDSSGNSADMTAVNLEAGDYNTDLPS